MNKDEILSEIKETLYPNLIKEQILLLSPKLLNELFRDEYKTYKTSFRGRWPLKNENAKDNKFLNKRAFNTLDSLNVKTMGDLLEVTIIESLRVHGCGGNTALKIDNFKHAVESTWVYVSCSKIEGLLPMWDKMIITMNNEIERLNSTRENERRYAKHNQENTGPSV
tara:strand:- start:64 stop:564 length:501 start_codon:yes stop_codon:yes gene_type:complete